MSIETTEITEIVRVAPRDALATFAVPIEDGKPHPIDPILARVRAEIDAFVPDIATPVGRKRIASMAYRIARAKTALDTAGKDLVAEQKKIPNLIDATRRHIRDTLDAWAGEVRGPLDVWEAADKARVTTHESRIADLNRWANEPMLPSEELRRRLEDARSTVVSTDACQEFLDAYTEAKDRAVTALTAALALQEQREAEAAELVRLRAAAAERDRADREEAARKAALAAAEARAVEIARAEKDKAEARERALKAEKDAAEAREREMAAKLEEQQKRAAADAEAAAQKARDEIEAKRRAEDAEAAKRAENARHRGKINRAALEAFVRAGLSEDMGKFVVGLIAKGEIPNVTIKY